MDALNSIEGKISGATSKVGNALSLADNILDNDIIVSDFLKGTEIGDFASGILDGIKDFLHKIGEFFTYLKNIIAKVLEFIKKILAFLDLNNLFDALGLSSLLDLIGNVVSSDLLTGNIFDRDSLLGILSDGCVNIEQENPFDNPMSFNVLSGLLLTLGCSGTVDAFDLLDKVLKVNTVETYTNTTEYIDTKITVIQGLDSTDETVSSIAQAQLDALVAERLLATNAYEDSINKTDTLLVKTFSTVFVLTKPENVEEVLFSMSRISAFDKAKYAGMTETMLLFIDKMDSMLAIPKAGLTHLENFRAESDLRFDTLMELLNRFDVSLSKIPSDLVSTLARIENESKTLVIGNDAEPISDLVRSMIRPVKISVGGVEC